jgi:hypothetical protein
MMKKFLLSLWCLGLFAQAEETREKAISEITAAATAFLSSLSPELKGKAEFSFADQERENWKFTPQSRKGVSLEMLDASQQALAKKLLATVLSEQGMLKANTIEDLEKLLGEMENNPVRRNHKAYFTSIFGKPDVKATWGYRYEGHHLAVNVTIIDGAHLIATPTFMGASPAKVAEGRLKGTHILAKEEELARALAVSVQQSGKAVVYTDKPPGEILTGEKRVAEQLSPVGVTAEAFTEEQKKLLHALIAEFANRHRPAIADKEIKTLQGLAPKDIRFGWAGSMEEGKAYYFRVQTPGILIEAANSQNNANHIHTVWRDHKDDFGRDSLGDHYKHDAH